MRPLLLAIAALLLLLAAAEADYPSVAEPATADKAKKYIDAMKQLSELIGKGFENVKILSNGLPGLLGYVSKAIGIINVLFGLPSSEGQQLKAYFDEVNRNFEKVFIQMDEVKRLISWESARGKYADDEKDLMALRLYYDRHLSNPDDDYTRNQFVDEYQKRQGGAATNLYLGIVSEGQVLLDNLAEASMQFTENNRRLTTDFLVGLMKLILQGSQMDILYYRLTQRDAVRREADWQEKLDVLVRKIDSTDAHLVSVWQDQAGKDINNVLSVHGGQSQGDLARTLYNRLKPKYYWKKWCVITSKSSNGDNYYVRPRGASWQNRNSHSKSYVISASDPKTLSMDAVKGAISDTQKQAYSVNIVTNMDSYFTQGLSNRGQSSGDYTYVIRALCASCRLSTAGDDGQHYAENFTSFWYIGIPVALDGNIAAC